MNRPVTVILVQGILLVLASGLLFSLVFQTVVSVRVGTNTSIRSLILGILIQGGLTIIFGAAFWGLAKRRRYGKWLGVTLLSLFLLLGLLIRIRPPQGATAPLEYNSVGQTLKNLSSVLIASVLMLILILRLAFAKSVDRFFSSHEAASMVERQEK